MRVLLSFVGKTNTLLSSLDRLKQLHSSPLISEVNTSSALNEESIKESRVELVVFSFCSAPPIIGKEAIMML